MGFMVPWQFMLLETGMDPKSHPDLTPSTHIAVSLVMCWAHGFIQAVFRIRMDLGFFADDPDPDFKNPDQDPFINKLMGSKWCFLLDLAGSNQKGQWEKCLIGIK